MADCPKCQTALEDDFGMVACSNCGAMIFLDMEGNPHIASEDEPSDFQAGPQAPAEAQFETPEEFEESVAEDFDMNQQFEMPASFESESEPDEIDEIDEPGETEEPEADFGLVEQAIEPEEPSFEPPVEEEPAEYEDLSDIADYGNSEVSQGKSGIIYYELTISGIDSLDLRNEVKASMEDSRFQWDIGQIMASIQGGELTLDQISPAKAVLIVKALRTLPLEITWRQKLLSQTEMQEAMPMMEEQQLDEFSTSTDEDDLY